MAGTLFLVSRWAGGIFLGYYVAYSAYVILGATAHDALPVFSQVMLIFVIPLTVVTLFIGMIRTLCREWKIGKP